VRQGKPTSAAQRALLTLVAVGVLVIFFLARSRFNPPHRNVPAHFKVDREIAADLRLGSNKQQVMDYCKNRGWDGYDQGRSITAVDRAADKNMILRTDVAITFDFDTADQLASFHAEDHYTGP
jgi:hypothetical protein